MCTKRPQHHEDCITCTRLWKFFSTLQLQSEIAMQFFAYRSFFFCYVAEYARTTDHDIVGHTF